MFDPYEWDYSVVPKTFERYRSHGYYINQVIEEHDGACAKCDIRGICGGINRQYNLMTEGKLIDSVRSPELAGSQDFYFYRQRNEAAFKW